MMSLPVSGCRSLGYMYVTAFPVELLGLHRQICARLPAPASRVERELVDVATYDGLPIRLLVGRLPLLHVFMTFAFFLLFSLVCFLHERELTDVDYAWFPISLLFGRSLLLGVLFSLTPFCFLRCSALCYLRAFSPSSLFR